MARVSPFSCTLFIALVAIKLCIIAAYNVVDFGAIGDGKTDSTSSFLKAWDEACNSIVPDATMVVPPGIFLVTHITFTGPCKSNNTNLIIFGTIIAPDDYKFIGSDKFWIVFHRVHWLSIFGGTLDAKGSSLWACKRAGNNCPFGARLCASQWFEIDQ
ncbi:PREDICTED: polygalacturonase-like [Erythranthe guttata]|uniref:polygalacturonase-like n=1 Tax=Erythranthe guttata TaxID=4155 RepID=UPI00064DB926|nr:PREDICTED: polygalacturonase-like [Erythranthe guttata]|eukprot:XP_012829373.1 PREDICTED: polygalacturonase-like [Erythranthe guttata]